MSFPMPPCVGCATPSLCISKYASGNRHWCANYPKPSPVKLALSLFPPVALAHAVHSLQDGNARPGRGAYNWRHGVEVRALEYADKAQRHIDLWKSGEPVAPDSLVHHLGCAIADLAIILDCEEQGLLVDDRQHDNGALQRIYDRIGAQLSKRKST